MTVVAIIEDEPLTRRALVMAMREAGFDVHDAADAHGCRKLLLSFAIDVVLLDLGLPDEDGVTLAAELRRRGDIGLVVVTRHSAPETRIALLDVGADDYLVKPVHLGELAARIRSVVRRRGPAEHRRRRLGDWLVDLDARSATDGERQANLTRGEFDILASLIAADGKIVDRDTLLAAISERPGEADLRSVDSLVSRIRRKLGDISETRRLILTSPGFGYRINVPHGDSSE